MGNKFHKGSNSSKLWVLIIAIYCQYNNNNAFYTNSNVLFFPPREVNFFRVRNPVGGFSIKLILPGPGFEPVTSRVAGRRCPCILGHLTQYGGLALAIQALLMPEANHTIMT